MAKALRVVFSIVLLPCAVVTPTSSRWRAASKIATAIVVAGITIDEDFGLGHELLDRDRRPDFTTHQNQFSEAYFALYFVLLTLVAAFLIAVIVIVRHLLGDQRGRP